MTTFILIALGIYFIVRLNKMPKRKTRKSQSLKKPPTLIRPIGDASHCFDLSPYCVHIPPLPEIKGSWLSMGKDRTILNAYAEEIGRCRLTAENAANSAITRFETDNKLLVDYQLQIHRRIYQSRRLLRRFDGLSQRALSSKDIPDVFEVTLPPKPSYPTPAELQRKYSLPPVSKVSSAMGNVLRNKGLHGSQKMVAAAVLGVALAIKSKSNISRLKRVLESSRGGVANYCISLKTTVEILEKTHPGIVDVSCRLKQCETELIEMIGVVSTIDRKINRLEQVPPDARKQLYLLYTLSTKAEQYSRKLI